MSFKTKCILTQTQNHIFLCDLENKLVNQPCGILDNSKKKKKQMKKKKEEEKEEKEEEEGEK